MKTKTINTESVKVALERIRGFQFEDFVNAFYPSLEGIEFTPLGGIADGGADGYKASGLWEKKNTGIFYQASIEKNHRSKITKTIKRLKEFGRKPRVLYYLTNIEINHLDQEEDFLSEKHNIRIKIRDKKYIVSHINDTHGTRAAFGSYLEPELDFLKYIGKSSVITPSHIETSPAIFVFLSQELARRSGHNKSLVNSITDGLILWALEGTDPDERNWMTEKQIYEKISDRVPRAAKMIKTAIPGSLERLYSRPRLIRFYTKEKAYCLTHKLRKRVIEDNIKDEALRVGVNDKFLSRFSSKDFDLDDKEIQICVDTSFIVLQRIFETEGIEFVGFIKNKRRESSPLPTIAEIIDRYFEEKDIKQSQWTKLKNAVLTNLQRAFYNSCEEERNYFNRLSETYTLLFCLNTEPRIVEYFGKLAANFQLYVGSDLIVRAFSEKYLHPEDRQTTNALKIISQAGGRLILSEPVLNEVYGHLKYTDKIFKDQYQKIEASVTAPIAQNFPEILVRAYFYARLNAPEEIKPPNNWSQFVDQFCNYRSLFSTTGKEALRRHLSVTFSMSYEDMEDLNKLTDQQKVSDLAERLKRSKRSIKLAERDALMTYAVYGRRRKNREHSNVTAFGYKTWWLTGETVILEYTKDLVERAGAKYIMNPEYLLRFLSIAPSGVEVRNTYRNIFPSILGIKLANRIDPETLNTVLEKLNEAQNTEPEARKARISYLTDELKTKYLATGSQKRQIKKT